MTTLTDLPEWQNLIKHQQEASSLSHLFAQDPNRFQQFSLEVADLFIDYSKNIITEKTVSLLIALAEKLKLSDQIDALFTGKIVNISENRPALHTALRDLSDPKPEVKITLERMADFSKHIRNSHFTDVVNIGIGGSDLGPLMAIEALNPYRNTSLRFHFLSNIDGAPVDRLLKDLTPATTLFTISSKSFTTIETLTNAKTAKQWAGQSDSHFIAITAYPERAKQFGISENNIFPIWDWVGGRYSLWSAVGLPIMLAIGKDNFYELLAGAYAIDKHFHSASFHQSIPVILGLIDIWYNNFFNAPARAILPYSHALKYLPSYLQQLHMESLGKNIQQDGAPVDYATGGIIFGDTGTNGQHSFYQLLHQGTPFIPTDFIVPVKPHHDLQEHHAILLANAFGQSKALMASNHPSSTILLPQLTPRTLGSLIALYEHRIFVQSAIWQINAFDQNGVELGKQLASTLLPQLLHNLTNSDQDSSTAGLIKHCHSRERGNH